MLREAAILLDPTATVLAYDLAVQGFQAVDINHVDVEYEWFLSVSHNVSNNLQVIPFIINIIS